MRFTPARRERHEKTDLSQRGILFLGRVCESLVSRLRSQHSFPGSHCCHLRIGPEGPARDRAVSMPLCSSSLTFRRATNPRTGNDWQPFRSRHGLASSMQGTFARRKQFRIRRRLFASAPTSRLSDFWRHNLRAGLIPRSEYRVEKRGEIQRHGNVENWNAAGSRYKCRGQWGLWMTYVKTIIWVEMKW